jgi:hypothetical protein
MILTLNSDYFLKQCNYLIFLMVKCGVLFEVRTEFLKYLDELRLQKINTLLLPGSILYVADRPTSVRTFTN